MTDLFNSFINIPGPTFLIYFAIFSIILNIIIWFVVKNIDSSEQYELPGSKALTVVEIATLRGGTNAVLRTVLLQLWQKECIKLEGNDKQEKKVTPGKDLNSDDHIQEVVFDYIKKVHSPKEIFSMQTDPVVRDIINQYIDYTREKLTNLHLLRTYKERQVIWIYYYITIIIFASTGGLKLGIGIYRSKPSVLLIFELIISLLILYAVSISTLYQPNKLGNKYLNLLKTQFNWAKEEYEKGNQTTAPDLMMAIFGVGCLSTIPALSIFAGFFNPSGSNGGCGGCSGGCGGCGGCGCGGCG